MRVAAGVPEMCFQILPTEPIAARTAMDLGVEKIVFTGSARTGAVIAEHAAQSFTPTVLELSGCDAVVIMPDADLDRAAQTIAVADERR
ncbi:MAG: aldehyde dehydrogenase family protein [Pirellulales bacterium]